MQHEHWEMAQRAQFYGEPSYGVPFDIMKYAQNDSFITINAALDFPWCRDRLFDLFYRTYIETPRPALLWEVSLVFVFNRGANESRWVRYQEAMHEHLLTDGLGNPIVYPGEPAWAIDPESNGVWETMYEFWSNELADQFGPGIVLPGLSPFGIFLDSGNDLPFRKWEAMGIIGQDFVRKRLAWKEGRTWLVKELRKRWGESIVLVLNWAKDPVNTPWDFIGDLNGLTVEGNPTTLRQRAILSMSQLYCIMKQRKAYLCTWNEKTRPLPFIPIGCHWAERSAGS